MILILAVIVFYVGYIIGMFLHNHSLKQKLYTQGKRLEKEFKKLNKKEKQ